MFSYDVLRLIWWLIAGGLLIGFAVMDGFDLGIAIIFRFTGQTDEERRALLAAVEPVWDGNQVWFILGGGAVFAAWPILYAASFSSLYLAMLLLLCTFILRPVGFMYRNKLSDPRWRAAWDGALMLGAVAAAILFGVAFGNLFLGLPFHFDELRRPVYTGGFVELLHPYALLCGFVSLSMLVMHGCAYATLKVGEPMAIRAARLGRTAATVFISTFLVGGVWAAAMRGYRIETIASTAAGPGPMAYFVYATPGEWLANYRTYPVLWLAPVGALLGALTTRFLLRVGCAGAAFVSSSLTQAGTILTAGFALFPFLMPSSTNYNDGLTVWNASSSERTLSIMLVAVMVFLPVVVVYTAWVFRVLRGRMTLEALREHPESY